MEQDNAREQRLLKAKLEHIRGKSYIPSELVDLLEGIAREQLAARSKAQVEAHGAEAHGAEAHGGFPEARELLQGKPLVERERFPFDEVQSLELFARFLGLAAAAPGALADAVKVVKAAISAGELEPADVFARILQDDADFFHEWAERTHDAPQTLYFLAFAAMSPSLAAAGEALAKNLPVVTSWAAGTCPVCGSLPLISRLQDKEGFRYDTCSFCCHEYRVRRMACAVCGESDQKKLTFFTVDDEPGFRVDVCASCKTYIKTIDFRALDRKVLPQFDDLDSLALDFVAREQGYSRPTLSAWGF